MNVEITVKNSNLTDGIREEVESRFSKFDKTQFSIINPHVVITKGKQNYLVEGDIGVPNAQLHATAEHENLFSAINGMSQKLERQLRRHVDKPNAHRGDRSGKDQCRAGVLTSEDITEDINEEIEVA